MNFTRAGNSFLTNVLGIALAFTTAKATAEPQFCRGKIKEILHQADGVVLIYATYRNEWTKLCSTESTWGEISPAVCKSWHASAQAAMLTSTDVLVYYKNTAACNLLPIYENSAPPFYLRMGSFTG